jgi:hypothetical protein
VDPGTDPMGKNLSCWVGLVGFRRRSKEKDNTIQIYFFASWQSPLLLRNVWIGRSDEMTNFAPEERKRIIE